MAVLAELIVSPILFCILTVTFVFTAIVLWRDIHKRANIWMLLSISIMYAASAIVFGLQYGMLLSQEGWGIRENQHVFVLKYFAQGIYEVLVAAVAGDGIILWRVFAVCPGKKLVLWTSCVLYLCSVASSIAALAYSVSQTSLAAYVTFATASLAFNVWTTAAIGTKAWRYRAMLRRRVAIVSRRVALERILGLLVESGIIYCGIWAFYIAVFASSASLTGLSMISTMALEFAVPFYPMVVVLFVAKQQTILEGETLTSIESCTQLGLAEDGGERYRTLSGSGEMMK